MLIVLNSEPVCAVAAAGINVSVMTTASVRTREPRIIGASRQATTSKGICVGPYCSTTVFALAS
jgi:hypothetical protein